VHHPESDCWFEVFSQQELDDVLGCGECNDVTGIPNHEAAFKQRAK
jgi:hypothetical protein